MIIKVKKFTVEKVTHFFSTCLSYPETSANDLKTKGEDSGPLRSEHSALQNKKFLHNGISFLWVIFSYLDPDPMPQT
jgi:hypothetical protein